MTTKCGHINKQYYNESGEREDLPCTLPVDHTGNHESDKVMGAWSDAAGEKSATKAVVVKGKGKTVVTESEQEESNGPSDGASDTETPGVSES